MKVDPDRLKIGDKIIVMVNGELRECAVYGEVYKQINEKDLRPGPVHLAAVEVYEDQQIYEFPMSEVLRIDELSEEQLKIVCGGMDSAGFERWRCELINEGG